MAKKGLHPKLHNTTYKYSCGKQFQAQSTNSAGVIYIASAWPLDSNPAWNKGQSNANARSNTNTSRFTARYGEDLFD